ncbi:4Fe-4S binding protein [Christensenellaceae bacterium OttesenSCG-928-K19]|nr:4Fe-4S binding protein [Christensenellaceae bacterium OttesenSCG-928-K19]
MVIIYEDTCKGCGLCAAACKKQLLAIRKDKLNAKGYHPIGIEDQDACVSCAACARMCPDTAIEVEKKD